MKRKWMQYLALFALMVQTFLGPIVAIAETINQEIPNNISQLNLDLVDSKGRTINKEGQLENNQSYQINVKGRGTFNEELEKDLVLHFSSNIRIEKQAYTVYDSAAMPIGVAQVEGQVIKIKPVNTFVDTDFYLNLEGSYQASEDTLEDVLSIKVNEATFDFPYALLKKEEARPFSAAIVTDSIEREPREITENIITKIDLEYDKNSGPTIDSKFTLNMEWKIPEEVRTTMIPGDTFSFNLPPELVVTTPISGVLNNEQNIGTYSVSTDGVVKLTFAEDVGTHEEVSGTFHFTSKLNEKLITVPTKETIKLKIKDEEHEFEIPLKSKTTNQISKGGQVDRNNNPKNITWTVDANKGKEELTNLVIEDTVPDGLVLSSIKVIEIKVNHDGEVLEELEEIPATDYTLDVKKGTVAFKGKTDKAYRLVYETKINESAKLAEGGRVAFVNKVSQKSDNEEPLTASSTVTASYRKLLDKKAVDYNSEEQSNKWEIKYNYGEKNIIGDKAYFEDFFPAEIRLKPNTLKLTKMELVGDEFKAQNELVEGQDYKFIETKSGFRIEFLKGLDYAVRSEYETIVKEDVLITENMTVENRVATEGNAEDLSGITLEQQGLIKYSLYNEVDYENHTNAWALTVNLNHYEMHNWKLEDKFVTGGLELKEDSVKIVTGKHVVLQKDKDYVLKNNGKKGFQLELIGDYKRTKEDFYITYRTYFDRRFLTSTNDYFVNKALDSWEDNEGNPYTNEYEAPFRPIEEVYQNGSKRGSYNAKTKEITWTIDTNFNGENLKDAKIIDVIQSNQNFVEGSVTLHTYNVRSNGSIELDEEIVSPKIEEPGKDSNQLIVHLPKESGEKGYRLEFKTSLKGEVIHRNYKNKAKLTSSTHGDDLLEADVTIKHGGTFATKEGYQDQEKPDFVNWKIYANRSQSQVKDYKIIDMPSTNQIIDEASIIVLQTEVDSEGNIRPTEERLTLDQDYKVLLSRDNETGQETMEILFLAEINEAYEIRYNSQLLLSEEDYVVTNKISASGNNEKVIENETVIPVYVEQSSGGASGGGVQTQFILKKIGKGTTKSITPKFLKGITFELLHHQTMKVLRTAETDEKGEIHFKNILSGKYFLREVKPKAGYLLENELAEGKEITVEKNNDVANPQVITVDNKVNKFIFRKQNEEGRAIQGASFNLLKKSELGFFEPSNKYFNLETNEKGEIQFEELEKGIYRIQELKPAAGYLKNTENFDFTITGEEKEPIVFEKAFVNYLGSAELRKVNEQDAPIQGAEFSVFNEQGVAIYTGLSSDATGRVVAEGLAPGTYYFQETRAVSGYVKNTEKVYFTIAESAAGKPEVVKAGKLVNSQGHVSFEKVDENGKGLEQAIFKLTDEAGEIIGENIASDESGQVVIKGLAPGTYSLSEVMAPSGYLINTKPIQFTIDDASEGKVQELALEKFINYQGKVKLIKINEEKQPLAGAIFKIIDETGKIVKDSLHSNEKGEVVFESLAPGTYSFVETEATKGYLLNTTPIEFTIPGESDGEPVVVNTDSLINYQGSVEIEKKDQNNKLLENAHFTLYDETGAVVQKDLLSNEKGKVKATGLAPGNYYFQETKAPTGYTLNDEKINFVIPESASQKPETVQAGELINYQGSVSFAKVDENGGKLSGAIFELYQADGTLIKQLFSEENGQVVAAELAPGKYYFKEIAAPTGFIINTDKIEFTIGEKSNSLPQNQDLGTFINYQGKIQFRKISGEKRDGRAELANAVFNLYQIADNGEETFLEAQTSKSSGEVLFTDLAPGKYRMREASAPAGYILRAEDIDFVIEKAQEGISHNAFADVFPANLYFENFKGSISMEKVDEADNGLEGAEFELTDDTGNSLRVTTDSQGKLEVKDLAPGSYQLTETKAPEGYVRNTKVVEFVIDSESQDGQQAVQLDKFINYHGSVKLTKVDEQNQPLEKAEFSLYRLEAGKEASLVQEHLSSDENGEIVVEELIPGDYYFEETQAPSDYILNKEKITFTIGTEAAEKPVQEKVTALNYQGSVILTKRNEKREAIADTIFELRNDQNEVIEKELITDENGQIEVKNLAPGKYYFKEIKATKNYIRNTELLSFEIMDEGKGKPEQLVLADFINYQGRVKLIKVSEKNPSKALEGAEFKLVDETGKMIKESLVTNKEGTIVVEGLAPGSYQFIETQAPRGYQLEAEPIRFTVENETKDQPKLIQIKVTNKEVTVPKKNKKGTKLPQTGEQANAVLLFLGFVISALVVIVYRRTKV